MKNAKLILTALFAVSVCSQTAVAGGGIKQSLCRQREKSSARPFTGDIATDLFAGSSKATRMDQVTSPFYFSDPEESPHHKSPVLAAVLSAAVPGAGEFYSESYLKSGLFFAAEVASWAVNLAYNRKGDRATTDFQNFANANWNVVDYASWLNARKGCSIEINGNTSLPPWKRVHWAQLNECERRLGGQFSHTLPPYGDQQYYELIGKYPQYNPGWKDADRERDVSDDNISELFKRYSGMRGHANDLYNAASTALLVVVVNHILSAADAAWSTTRYNKFQAELGMKMRRLPFGAELVPTASVRVRW